MYGPQFLLRKTHLTRHLDQAVNFLLILSGQVQHEGVGSLFLMRIRVSMYIKGLYIKNSEMEFTVDTKAELPSLLNSPSLLG